MNKYDVVIIGSGLGGLTAGAYLSKKGLKVALLEQHYKVGGFATTYARKNTQIDLGLHALNGLDDNAMLSNMLDELGILSQLELIRLGEFYHTKFRAEDFELDYTIEDDFSLLMKKLFSDFPQSKNFINDFFTTIKLIRDEIKTYYKSLMYEPSSKDLHSYPNIMKYAQVTLGDYLSSCSDIKLWLLLTNNVGFYHDNPYDVSFLSFASGHASYFLGGSWYIKGGSQILSNKLRDIIINNGGTVELSTRAKTISTNEGRIQSVIAQKTRGNKGERVYETNRVIANCSPNFVYNNLIPEYAEHKRTKLINRSEKSTSVTMLKLFLNDNAKAYKNSHHYTNFVTSNETEKNLSQLIKPTTKIDTYKDLIHGFAITDYGVHNTGLCKKGHSSLLVMEQDKMKQWKSSDEASYRQQKTLKSKELLSKVQNYFPNINDFIKYSELSTPHTIKNFTNNDDGAIYGYALYPNNSNHLRMGSKSLLPQLYFASAWVRPGPGFESSMLSGWLAQKQLLEDINE